MSPIFQKLFNEYILQMLVDQTDFLVIGVIGGQGVGKSTILSLLAGNSPEDSLR